MSRASVVLIALFVVLAAAWAAAVPVPLGGIRFLNPDETSHLEVVAYVAAHHAWPPYSGVYYESIHPPLYYVLGAIVWSIVPSAIVLRLLNVVIGAACFVAAERLARRFPRVDSRLCASLLVFLPGFLTACGSVSNDPLATLFGILVFDQIIAGVQHGFDRSRASRLTIALAAGALTKETCLIYLPVAAMALAMRRARRPLVITAVGVTALAGWWYLRNTVLYGDPMRTRAEAALLANLPGFQDVHVSAWRYWGHVIAGALVTLPGIYRNWLPLPIYVVYAALAVVALLRLIVDPSRASRELVLGATVVAGAVTVFAAYNYHHFMPMVRLVYPALPPAALGSAVLLRPHSRAVLVAIIACAALTVATMPRNWISPEREPTFRWVVQTYRTTPLPTGF